MPPPRSSEEIVAEIRERFGFLPPFFAPALSSPALLENLWQQTLSAYVENPLPALFKEKLFAHLSRYCVVPYCLVCHSCALRPLGMTPAEVLATIERPAPVDESELSQLDAALAAAAPLTDWPAPGTPLDDILHRASMMVFLDLGPAARYRAELRRLLADSYDQLVVFLAYVKTCFTWVEAHPELSWEADRRAQEHLSPLLADEPSLAVFFEQGKVFFCPLIEHEGAACRTFEGAHHVVVAVLRTHQVNGDFCAAERQAKVAPAHCTAMVATQGRI